MVAALLTALGLVFNFGSTTIQSYICQPPEPPVILQPTDGSTVSAGQVNVSGTATASSQVVLSVDGQATVQLTADGYNTFSGQVPLTTGTHRLSIASNSVCGNSTGSDITVNATQPLIPPPASGSTTPPTALVATGSGSLSNLSGGGETNQQPNGDLQLYITAPRPDSRVIRSAVLITGTTSQPALIRIFSGDKELARTFVASTTFGLSVPLQVGTNDLNIQATAGSAMASSNLTVVRIPAAHSITIEQTRPWPETLPGIVTISTVSAVMLALIVWILILR